MKKVNKLVIFNNCAIMPTNLLQKLTEIASLYGFTPKNKKNDLHYFCLKFFESDVEFDVDEAVRIVKYFDKFFNVITFSFNTCYDRDNTICPEPHLYICIGNKK